MAKHSSEANWDAPPLAGPVISFRARGDCASAVPDHQSARAEGYARGHEEGLAAGLRQMESTRLEVERHGAALASLVNRLAHPLERIEGIAERQLTQLACAVGAHLAQGELLTDPTRVATLIRHCIAAMPPTVEAMQLRLNPTDIITVEELSIRALHGGSVEIVSDASIERGGCVLESRDSSVDATWRARLDRVVATVLEGT